MAVYEGNVPMEGCTIYDNTAATVRAHACVLRPHSPLVLAPQRPACLRVHPQASRMCSSVLPWVGLRVCACAEALVEVVAWRGGGAVHIGLRGLMGWCVRGACRGGLSWT